MPLGRMAVFFAAWAASLAFGAAGLWAAAPGRARAAESSAVVFAYQRFGEDSNPASSVRVEQFEAQLRELLEGGYAVLPLPVILKALAAGTPLPERAAAITIDGASRSAFDVAWPRLRTAGLPFTVFVSPDDHDRASPAHMTWRELGQMASAGVGVGALGASGRSFARRPTADVLAELRRARTRLQAELRAAPSLLAWPLGDHTPVLVKLAADLGFAAAFGQQPGALPAFPHRGALPRFVVNEGFGGIERFRIATNALPLPVEDVTPADPVLTVNPPTLGFTIAEPLGGLSRLACFASGYGRARVERIADVRVEVRFGAPFPPGRHRVHCTLPTQDGRWRWFGAQFLVPE